MLPLLLAFFAAAQIFILPGLALPFIWKRDDWCLCAGILSIIYFYTVCLIASIGFEALTVPVVLPCLILPSIVGCIQLIRHRQKVIDEIEKLLRWSVSYPGLLSLCILVCACLRFFVMPLPGPDTDFRWNHLAYLLLDHGNLSFYPPASAESFSNYFFVDGIPPLVSFTYWWIYSLAGVIEPVWTLFSVLPQVLLCLLVVRAIGTSSEGAWRGWLLLACPLFLWSVFMGQDTAMTAMAAGAAYYFIRESARKGEYPLLLMAAAATASGVVTREYMGLFAAVGCLQVIVQWRSFRPLLVYAAVVCVLGGGWYLRNLLIFGNPFAYLGVGSLLPVDKLAEAWWEFTRANYSTANSPGSWLRAAQVSLITSLPLVTALWFSRRRLRELDVWFLLYGCVVLFLYYRSIPYTAVGFGFVLALRVLTPLCLLAAATLPEILAARGSLFRRVWLPILLTLFSCYVTLFEAGYFPTQSLMNPKPRNVLTQGYKEANFEPLERFVDGQKLLCLNQHYLARMDFLRRAGKGLNFDAGSLFSPEFRFLFSRDLSFDEQLERLHEAKITYLFIHSRDVGSQFLGRYPFFIEARNQLLPTYVNGEFVGFLVQRLEPK